MSTSTSAIDLATGRSEAITDRAVIWAAWGFCVLTLVLMACALSLARLNRGGPELLLLSIGVVSSGLVGGVVSSKRHTNPIGWIFAIGGATFALMAVASEYAVYGLVTQPGSLPGALFLAWLQAVLVVPVVISLLAVMPLIFPDGHLVSPRWRPVLWLTVGWGLMEGIGIALRPGELEAIPGVANPLGTVRLRSAIELVQDISLAIWLVIIGAVCGSLVVRLRRSDAEERQQVKWLAYAVIGWVLMVLLSYPAAAIHPTAEQATEMGVAMAFAGIPIAAGIAVLRYRLYDIDVIINRTLVYGVLTLGVAGLYVLVVGYLATVFHVRDHLAVSLLSTGLVALLFQPVRDRLQHGVNRLMYGDRDEPYRVLSQLGQRLEASLAPGETLPAIVQTVTDALHLPYAAISLGHEDGRPVAAAIGQPVSNPLRLPLVYQGEPVGELLLGLRPGEASLAPADWRLLEDLARQAGAAVHAVRLTADLQRSRELMVTAREEERRRLRQDLHDGLGPTLASVSLQLAALRNQVADNPEAAATLTGVKEQIQDAVKDIRRLVYALRPPTLDELGLVGAIEEHAVRLGQGGLSVSVEVPEPLPMLPAAVEVAAYRITLEALTNVALHGHAASCIVRLSVVDASNGASGGQKQSTVAIDRSLCLEIVDDGWGIDPRARAGTGLVSMRERAVELGGIILIEPGVSGGTAVRAWLPFAVPAG